MYFPIIRYLPVIVLCAAVMILQPACQRQESNKPKGSRQAAQADIPLTNQNAYETVLRKLKENPTFSLASVPFISIVVGPS